MGPDPVYFENVKVLYVRCSPADIIHFEGPPGSMVFWPDGYPNPKDYREKGPPCWKVLETKKDSLAPRTRILTVTAEIELKDFKAKLQEAHALLPEDVDKEALLGVTLKGDVYDAESKRWQLIGFFLIPSAQAWIDLYDDGIVETYSKAPEGMVAEIS